MRAMNLDEGGHQGRPDTMTISEDRKSWRPGWPPGHDDDQ
jgi:hypothetical protein